MGAQEGEPAIDSPHVPAPIGAPTLDGLNPRQAPLLVLGSQDIAGAQALVVEAGWNQVPADWDLFTRLGHAFKIAAPDGTIAATAATLPYSGGGFGWISMVLVAQAHRRHGLATRLLRHCIDYLRAEELVPVLDATAAGRTVYEPMGFIDGWGISRWRCPGTCPQLDTSYAMGVTVRPMHNDDWRAVLALDLDAFGADRAPVLDMLWSRCGHFACVAERGGRLLGYLMGRNGRTATQIGPMVAFEEGAALALVRHAFARIDGPVLVDAVNRHRLVANELARAGFSVERGYTRMAWGLGRAVGDEVLTMAIAGPELG